MAPALAAAFIRTLGKELAPINGQSIIIVNTPGGATQMAEVRAAKPDGLPLGINTAARFAGMLANRRGAFSPRRFRMDRYGAGRTCRCRDVGISNLGPALIFSEAGRLRALRFLKEKRLKTPPDMTVFSEAGGDVDTGWTQMQGVFGPQKYAMVVKALTKVAQTQPRTAGILRQ
ncbi:MAG: tripartite-type tricarboxylate transporter receptor subunit TctC [Paracoccaceae bacterium]